jgi:FkbM family methyltransferase
LKLKTLVHRKVRKLVYRTVRYHWLTEQLLSTFAPTPRLALPEVGLEIDVWPGDIIIDCGANVGDITSRFARSGAEVYAFEPNPLVFRILNRRFRGLSRVHCFNQGVMDRECLLSLNLPAPKASSDAIDVSVAASFVGHAGNTPEGTLRQVDIDCIDLAAFIASLKSGVCLLKLDIEGAELPVLNSLIDTGAIHRIDHVVVETHEKQMPHLLADTEALRARLRHENLEKKVRLDWV